MLSSATRPTRRNTIHRHPGAHPNLVPWLLEKEIRIWGVDCVSTDHPMNLPIGRFLGKGQHGHCNRVRKQAEDKFGGKEAVDALFPDSAYQLTHNALFPKDCMHIENLGGDIAAPRAAEQAADSRMLPLEVQRRRGGVLPRRGVRGRLDAVSLADLAATELRRRIAAREVTDRESVEACLERVAQLNPTLNAIVTPNPNALEDAAQLDRRIKTG